MANLSRHTFRVALVDGSAPFEVTTILADQINYETTRNRRKWPMIQDGGVQTWWAFLAWSAASRTGVYTGTYEDFVTAAADVEDLTDDDDGNGDPVDPTRPAAPAS